MQARAAAAVAVVMESARRAGKVTAIIVANRGTGPRIAATSSLRKTKKNMHLWPKRRSQRFSMLRLNLRCCRQRVGVVAAGRSQMEVWVVARQTNGVCVLVWVVQV
jgi:hypothetical protein